MRLLLVEDEPSLALTLRESLPAYGFKPTVAGSVGAAREALWAGAFDLIVLDVTLPEGAEAGFGFAKALREDRFSQPILFLSAREGLSDRLRGLEHGDDYLAKPFALPELVARLRALYRRGERRPRRTLWQDVELHADARQVLQGGMLVRLSGKEYEVLELFMLNPGRVFARGEVLERVWGVGYAASSNLVDVYVKNLRARFADELIETVRGLGYRFPG